MSEVLFDLSRQGYVAWRDAGIPGGIAVVALCLVLVTRSAAVAGELRTLRQFHLMMRVVAVVAVLGVLVILGDTWSEFQYLREAETQGRYRLTSGIVSAFVPEGPRGRPHESFNVGDVHFEYSSNDVTSAYHRTIREGGKVREGLMVRIQHRDGKIIRLETGTGVAQ
jgi:hypothetical protein